MAEALKVSVEGLEELREQFSALSDRMQAKALRDAMRGAARPVVQEARARAPVRTGRLRRNIIAKVFSGPKTVTAIIGFRAEGKRGDVRNAFYGMFLELGTSRMTARPMLRPALDAKGGEAVSLFAAALRKAIEAITRKARGG